MDGDAMVDDGCELTQSFQTSNEEEPGETCMLQQADTLLKSLVKVLTVPAMSLLHEEWDVHGVEGCLSTMQ